MQDSSGKWWDAPARQTAAVLPGEKGTLQLQWQPTETAPQGAYVATVALWVDYDSDTGLMVGELDRKTREKAFRLNAIAVHASGLGWNKTWGGSSDDRAQSVQQASDGGYIIAGETESYGEGKRMPG